MAKRATLFGKMHYLGTLLPSHYSRVLTGYQGYSNKSSAFHTIGKLKIFIIFRSHFNREWAIEIK